MTELDAKIEEIFDRADDFMINHKDYEKAKALFEEILSLDPDNIDGLNSLAQCVKSIYNCQVSEGAQSDP
jgi:tetratricopeptide (TPR) repeat protein